MSKTALVTGSAGFIGRHMVRELESRGYDVFGCDLEYNNPPNEHGTYSVSKKQLDAPERVVCWNAHAIFDQDDPSDYHDEQPRDGIYDLVVHAAYHVGGRAAIDGINTNFAKNLQLDAAMFEWAVRTKQKRVLYFSSSAVYPRAWQTQEAVEDAWQDSRYDGRKLYESEFSIDEDWIGQPDANYGFAKLVGERLAEDARRNGLQVSVVRPFSGASGRQSLDYPFPSIVNRAKNGDLSVWGDPNQARDWLDVTDVVNGALAVVDSETADPVNLCSGVPTSMADLARMAFKMSNPGQPVPDVISVPGPEGVYYRVGDPTRFFKLYKPKKTVEDMVHEALSAM